MLLDDGSVRLRARLALRCRRTSRSRRGDRRSTATKRSTARCAAATGSRRGILKGFVDGVVEARTASLLGPVRGRRLERAPGMDAGPARRVRRRGRPAGWQLRDPCHRRWRRPHGARCVRAARRRRTRPAADRRHRVEHVETDRPSGHPAVRPARRRGLDAALSRRPVAEPDRGVGRRHRTGPSRTGLVVGVDPTLGCGRRLRVRLAGRAVRPVPRAQRGRQSADGRRPPGGRLAPEREAVAARRARGVRARIGVRGLRGAPARDARWGWMPTSSSSTAISSPEAHRAIIGTRVALTVVGGEIVHRSEDVG